MTCRTCDCADKAADTDEWVTFAKRPVEPLTSWSHHDIPELAAEKVSEVRRLTVEAATQREWFEAADAAADRRLDQSIAWMERAEAAEAEVVTLRANWRHVTKSLGYGDGVTEPQIGHVEFVAECERQFSEASEWRESQRWRDECHDAGHPDDEDCYEHDPALVLLTLRAKVTAVEAKRDEFADLLARALPAVAALARVEALGDGNPDHADTCGSMLTPGAGYPCSCWLADLRAALAGSDADTGEQETGHKCEPYYSRSECGRCGWQEQWCATCSRQMCRCATDAMGADQ